jgi:two-component system chemotaxis response regulator CheB
MDSVNLAKPINVMITDDSLVIRSMLKKIMGQDSLINVVVSASNGEEAIDRIKLYKEVEVMLLDIEMPIMDGLTAIPYLLRENPELKIIVVSSLTSPGAKYTLQSLELGASDYIEKPNDKIDLESFSKNLLDKIKILGFAKRGLEYVYSEIVNNNELEIKLKEIPTLFKVDVIAIASSTGGPKALMDFLNGFSKDFFLDKSIFLTQHIRKDFINLLVENLNHSSKLYCKIPEDKEEVKKGVIYVAPSDFHMEVEKVSGSLYIRLTSSAPENFCRPSADPMLRSLARVSHNVVAVILTGIGLDGLNGSKAVADNGGVVIAQNKETSVVWGMPGAVAKAGICSAILPINELSSYIQKNLR